MKPDISQFPWIVGKKYSCEMDLSRVNACLVVCVWLYVSFTAPGSHRCANGTVTYCTYNLQNRVQIKVALIPVNRRKRSILLRWNPSFHFAFPQAYFPLFTSHAARRSSFVCYRWRGRKSAPLFTKEEERRTSHIIRTLPRLPTEFFIFHSPDGGNLSLPNVLR